MCRCYGETLSTYHFAQKHKTLTACLSWVLLRAFVHRNISSSIASLCLGSCRLILALNSTSIYCFPVIFLIHRHRRIVHSLMSLFILVFPKEISFMETVNVIGLLNRSTNFLSVPCTVCWTWILQCTFKRSITLKNSFSIDFSKWLMTDSIRINLQTAPYNCRREVYLVYWISYSNTTSVLLTFSKRQADFTRWSRFESVFKTLNSSKKKN